MKTIGRILIILAVFSALSGLMVFAVNASGSAFSNLESAALQFRPQADGNDFSPQTGTNPEGAHTRPMRGDRAGAGGSRWMFGLVKNVGVMAILVVLIALPKSLVKKKRKPAATSSANSQTQ